MIGIKITKYFTNISYLHMDIHNAFYKYIIKVRGKERGDREKEGDSKGNEK